ncbi:MAG: nucleotidyl transferase AbiEii/AbiGii toxin family protein [Candidatus Micrarchaeaceae archaeon]
MEPGLVMHGGTAIWRCYNGNRFSEDIDLYATDEQMKTLDKELTWALSKRDVKLDYPKISMRVVTFHDEFASSKLEAMKPEKKVASVEKEFERANGSRFFINTLSAEDLIIEKVYTYQKRRFIRDFYDIYHLLDMAKQTTKVKRALSSLVENIEAPIKGQNLSDLVYIGIAPSFGTMLNRIKGKLE